MGPVATGEWFLAQAATTKWADLDLALWLAIAATIATIWGLGCGLLWGAFYTLRWIVRGFRESRDTK
jgi:hypothetical protein